MSNSPEAPAGSFAPLQQTLFAVLWVATVIGNTGSFIRDVASAWLMTDLSPSPAAVALVQAAATLPVVLLAIPAVLFALLVGASALALVGFAAHRVKLAQGDADLVLRPIDK